MYCIEFVLRLICYGLTINVKPFCLKKNGTNPNSGSEVNHDGNGTEETVREVKKLNYYFKVASSYRSSLLYKSMMQQV